jgi:hypothetical protein
MRRILVISICFVYLLGAVCHASGGTLNLQLDMPSADVGKLMDAGDFVGAERLAREQGVDPRVIATILAYQGKKSESFAIFNEVIENAPESQREDFFYQAVNLLTRPGLEQQFWDQMVPRGIIRFTDGKKKCAEVRNLLRSGNVNAAEKLYNQVLESSYTSEDAVRTGLTFVHSQYTIEEAGKFQEMLEKMMIKFPKEAAIHLKWIDTLSTTEPSRALAELDVFRKSEPKLYAEQEKKIHLIRGRSLENLGERERAKKEYQAIADNDPDSIANATLREYEQREKIEQKIQEEFREQYPDYNPNFTIERNKRGIVFYLCLVAFHILGLVIIYYLLLRKRK